MPTIKTNQIISMVMGRSSGEPFNDKLAPL